jgi:hypothetical protein
MDQSLISLDEFFREKTIEPTHAGTLRNRLDHCTGYSLYIPLGHVLGMTKPEKRPDPRKCCGIGAHYHWLLISGFRVQVPGVH